MLKMASSVPDGSLAEYSRARHQLLKRQIHQAENESDLRQPLLSIFDLDLFGNLEKYRVDYAHPNLWMEIKFRLDISILDERCRIISQMLHYIYQVPAVRKEFIVPDSFCIADPKRIMFYNTCDFGNYFLNPAYFEGIQSPSAPHPELEAVLKTDPIVTARPYFILPEYDKIWSEFHSRGVYE